MAVSAAPDGVPDGGVPDGAGASARVVSPPRPRTRLQAGVRKPKQFTDGIVRYGLLATNGKPNNLDEALQDKN